MIKSYIKREKYLEKLRPFARKDIIKVLIGQRRVGKSYLLFGIIYEIREKDKKANIIYINKESHEFEGINNCSALIRFVEKSSKPVKKNYLFIDEIQEIDKFEKALRHFQSSGKYDIYCTGSSAEIMSGELATGLSGRYIEIPVYSLSYKEFLEFHKLSAGDESFLKYIKFGGLPYLINLKLEDEIVYNYLQSIYNTIILKDVVKRFSIRNIDFLDRLVFYLADNIGNLVSAHKISDFLKSQKIKISPNSVLNYLDNLASSFFIFKCLRQNIKGKKVFEINEKYYFGDLGLRHTLIGYRQTDLNKILENLVFNQLKYLGYSVKIGKLENKEIDFVAERQDRTVYLQVTYLINNKKTEEREFGNLLAIPDAYPKYVVSMDALAGGSYKGIKQLNIKDFLLNFE
jgi:uncharacterized protein